MFAMTETASKPQIFLANMAIVLVIAFGVGGLVWYGFSAEVRQRFWDDLLERPGGPMTFRFILQPIMAAIAALHDGMKDATVRPLALSVDNPRQFEGARRTLARRADRYSPGHSFGSVHGRDLSACRAQDILSR